MNIYHGNIIKKNLRTVVHGVKEDLIDYEHWIHRRRTKMGLVNMYKEICFVLHKHRHTWEARNCEMYKLTLSFLFVILSGFIILYIQIDQKHNDLKTKLAFSCAIVSVITVTSIAVFTINLSPRSLTKKKGSYIH